MGKDGVTTNELWARLFKSPSINEFLAQNSGEIVMPSFPDYISSLCEARGERAEQVINRAGIERSFGHRLFSGTRNPSRDTVLQLAFGFELTTDETQQLLRVAQATPLHPKVKRDAVIAYFLHNGKQLIDVQDALYENGLPLIGGKRNG